MSKEIRLAYWSENVQSRIPGERCLENVDKEIESDCPDVHFLFLTKENYQEELDFAKKQFERAREKGNLFELKLYRNMIEDIEQHKYVV